jgi:hypothetical protein
MRDIMKTNTGKNYISQFMKKDSMFYGYKALSNGKYSDVVLNIVQYELDKKNKIYEGSIGFGHREGNVTLSQSIEGRLLINIYTNQTDIDAISHELFVHNAGEIEDIIQAFRRGGLAEAERVNAKGPSADEDHKALRDLDTKHKGIKMYKKLTEELKSLNSEYKEIFEKVEEINHTKYGTLK